MIDIVRVKGGDIMQNSRIIFKNKSTMSKGEYLFYHILYGTVFAYDVFKILPILIPIAYFNNSVYRLILCMITTSLLGIVISFNHYRTGLGVLSDIVAGIGIYTILTVGMYTPVFVRVLVFSTLIVSGICICLIVFKRVRNKNVIKQIILIRVLRSMRVVRRNIGIAAAIAIIVLPIELRMGTNELLQKDYTKLCAEYYYGDTKSSTNTSYSQYKDLEVNEIYGDEYKLSKNISTIKLIRDNDTFQGLSYDEKCEVIKSIIYCEARYQGLCKINVMFEELENKTLGKYCHSTRTITINAKQIKDGSLPGGSNEEILDSCLHETRHVYQYLMVDMYRQATPEQRNILAFVKEGVGSWSNNIGNYHLETSSPEDCIEYYGQPLEKDANNYAKREKLEYFSIIDKLIKKQKN